MKNFGQTMAYLFKYGKGKRFSLFFLLLLIPCAVTAYFFPLSDYLTFFFDYSALSFPSWGSLWLASFNTSVPALIGLACSFALFVLGVAYITTVVTRHIRVGELVFPKLLYSVNENFFPALALTLFYLVTIAFFHFIYTLFVFMWMRLLKKAFALALSIIIFFLLSTVVTYFLSATTLWLPTMSFTGQYALKSLGVAFYKSRSYQRHFFVPSIIAVGIIFALSLAAHFTRSVWYVKWIINTVCYACTAVFFIVFSLISYCEAEAVKREDLAKGFFGR